MLGLPAEVVVAVIGGLYALLALLNPRAALYVIPPAMALGPELPLGSVSVRPEDLMLVVLVVGWLLRRAGTSRIPTPLDRPLVLYAAVGVIATLWGAAIGTANLWSTHPWSASGFHALKRIELVLLFFMLTDSVHTVDDARRLVYVFMASLAGLCAYSLTRFYDTGHIALGPEGTPIHEPGLAAMLNVGLALGFLVTSRRFATSVLFGGVLLGSLDGAALDEPRQLRFVTGRRRKSWIKNCVAVGLSAGFVEPLESTSISLIETAVGKLVELFPDRDCRPELANEFNRYMGVRYESVRDFIILHYKLTERDDSEFWRYCANIRLPDSLRHQIELFRETGRVTILDPHGFAEPSFVAMLMGLGAVPKRYDPFVDTVDIREVHGHFAGVRDMIAQAVERMPTHDAYIASQLAAASPRAA